MMRTMSDKTLDSIPGVCEVSRTTTERRPPDFLIELPHGATRESHFDATRARLTGDYAADLKEFFFVNTDVGAPECAAEIAGALARTGAGVLIVRGLVPRTFIDCNRVIDGGLRGDEMTPTVPGYVREQQDIETLTAMYREYQGVAGRAYEQVCGAGGLALTLHTYAPRSVDIKRIDDDIVRALHEAYEPERFETWERRPDIDVISEDTEGKRLAPSAVVDRLKREYAAIGIEVAENATYRLHPETMGHVHSSAYPGQVLCMEINRQQLADPFTPFAEMHIGPEKAARMAAPVAKALLR
jgi:hypothetical protein